MNKEDLQKFFDKSTSPKIGFKGFCHDCGHEMAIKVDMATDGKVTIEGGALYYPQVGPTQNDKKLFLKCAACFKQNPTLKDYQPCDVYSRVVGYLRPVSDWNEGKQDEFKLRSTYEI